MQGHHFNSLLDPRFRGDDLFRGTLAANQINLLKLVMKPPLNHLMLNGEIP